MLTSESESNETDSAEQIESNDETSIPKLYCQVIMKKKNKGIHQVTKLNDKTQF